MHSPNLDSHRVITERFESRSAEAGASIHHGAAVLRRLLGCTTPVVSPCAWRQHPDLLGPIEPHHAVRRSDGSTSPVRVDIEVGIGYAEAAVAETGSVFVDETDIDDRVVHMMSHHLIVLVERGRIVERLDDLASSLEDRAAQPFYGCLLTGPSRTADIERSLTVGVQGPTVVDIVIL